MSLINALINESVKILEINCESNLKHRLYDLGLVPDTIITPVFVSPFGDPIAYEFRGNIIAIRKSDAKSIIIKKKNKFLPNSNC